MEAWQFLFFAKIYKRSNSVKAKTSGQPAHNGYPMSSLDRNFPFPKRLPRNKNQETNQKMKECRIQSIGDYSWKPLLAVVFNQISSEFV